MVPQGSAMFYAINVLWWDTEFRTVYHDADWTARRHVIVHVIVHGLRELRPACDQPGAERRRAQAGTEPSVALESAADVEKCFDLLPAIRVRAPDVAERLVQGLEAHGGSEPPSLVSAHTAAALLRGRGFAVPTWNSFSPVPPGDGDRDDPFRGWQWRAAMVCDERALEMHLSDLDTASRALLLSQATARRACPHSKADCHGAPHPTGPVPGAAPAPRAAPVAPRPCSCHGHLDALGDHRSACATSGVLPRALPLERAVPCVPGSGRAGVPQCAPGGYECRCAPRGRTSH